MQRLSKSPVAAVVLQRAQQRLGSELHAVKHLESAAECASKDKRHEDACNLYKAAYETFASIGKVAMGAAALSR